MRKFAGIIESTIAPPINCLWLNNGELKANINGEWVNITTQGSIGGDTENIIILDLSEEQSNTLFTGQEIIIENGNFIGGVNSIVLRSTNNSFYVLNKTSGFDSTYIYRGYISDLTPFNNNTTFSTKIIYIDGILNISSGTFTFKMIDTDVPEDIIGLQIGNSSSVKANNLAILNKFNLPYFFTQIDYGYGVGTFSSAQGGFIHITNAYGDEVFYNIGTDGSIAKNEHYIKPNEPYSLILHSNKINTVLDDVTANKILDCGELIIKHSAGANTYTPYTRTEESTPSVIYFSSIRKDGKVSVLTYTVSTKKITAALTNPYLPSASASSIGGVKKMPAIADIVVESANSEILAGKINDLLSALRSSGALQE